MQVNNINSVNQAPNFTALKSIKYKGLYKDFPEASRKVLQAFQSNQKAVDFCKTHDVNIVVEAYNELYKLTAGRCTFTMEYKKAAKNNWQKFKNFFKFSNEISIKEAIYEYKDIKADFIDSTNSLSKKISSEDCVFEDYKLSTQLEKILSKEEAIEKEKLKDREYAEWKKQRKIEYKFKQEELDEEKINVKKADKRLLEKETKRFINSQNN
jgi:hypothetical protein